MFKRESDAGLRSDYTEIFDPDRLVSKPLVSVSMVTFNHAEYISIAIGSVVEQVAGFDFELVIGDDGSTDATLEVAIEWQKRFPEIIRLVRGSKNVGAQLNRERLAELVRGEFVAFCEGDDYWIDRGKLQRQVAFLLENPSYGAVHSDFRHVVWRRRSWRRLDYFQRRMRGLMPSGDIFLQLLGGNFIQTCTVCVRRNLDTEFLASAASKPTYPVGDWPLALFIAQRSGVGYQNEQTAAYRRVRGSIMHSSARKRLSLVSRYDEIIDDFCSMYDVSNHVRIASLTNLHTELLSMAFLADDNAAFDRSWRWLAHYSSSSIKLRRRAFLRFAAHHHLIGSALRFAVERYVALREAWLYRLAA